AGRVARRRGAGSCPSWRSAAGRRPLPCSPTGTCSRRRSPSFTENGHPRFARCQPAGRYPSSEARRLLVPVELDVSKRRKSEARLGKERSLPGSRFFVDEEEAIDQTWQTIEAKEQAIQAKEQAIETREYLSSTIEHLVSTKVQVVSIEEYFSSIDCKL